MKKFKTTFLMVMTTVTFVFGQTQEATTTDGKKVILNSNGTWKYVEVKKEISNSNTADCSKWIITDIDEVGGNTNTGSKNFLIVTNDGEEGFRILMQQIPRGGVAIFIRAVGAGSCIDEEALINILFTDGSRLELSNDGKFNCKAEASLYFGEIFGKKSQLEELKTKKIQTLRVWTSDSYVEKDFTKDNQEEFYNVINCLTK